MRMDHYVKTGNNNIHLANILYAILLIGALVLSLTFLLNRTIRADFKNIDLIIAKLSFYYNSLKISFSIQRYNVDSV